MKYLSLEKKEERVFFFFFDILFTYAQTCIYYLFICLSV